MAAHDLKVIVECEKAKFDVDFYQKTLHSHEYFTAPKPGDVAAVGANDNSWCSDPQAVIDLLELPRLTFPVTGMTVGWPVKPPPASADPARDL